MSKVIGILSIKGGVGKTTSALNLASALANDYNKRVLLIDTNYSSPTLGLHLGLVDYPYTIHDVLSNKVGIEKAVIAHNFNFDVVLGDLLCSKVNPYALRNRLKKVKNNYDFIILDSSPNLNDEMLSTMIASDELFVVTTPDWPTLSSTMHAVKVARDRGTNITGLILNRVRNKNYELTVKDIELSTNVPVLALVRDTDAVLSSLADYLPVVQSKPTIDASIEFKRLAGALQGELYNDTRMTSLFKKFLFRQTSASEFNVKRYVLNQKANIIDEE